MDDAHNKLLERLRTYYGDDLACRTLLMDARHALEALAGEVEQWRAAFNRLQERALAKEQALADCTAERDRLKAALEGVCAIAYDHGSIAAIAHARKALGDAS